MAKNKKTVSLDQVKDKYIGKTGTIKRDLYEVELKHDITKC